MKQKSNKVDISFNEIRNMIKLGWVMIKPIITPHGAVWSISGDWEFLVNGAYTHKYTITQTGNAFTGSGAH